MCPFIETIRIEDGKIYNINYHTERCNRTRAAFWQDVADIDLGEFISPQSLEGIWKCRIVYGKGDRRNYIRSLSEAQSFLFTSGYVGYY